MASITKRLSKTGEVSYLIRAFVAWGQDGKQITKSMTWKPPANMSEKKAKKEAEREALLFEESIKRGIVTVDGKTKFGDYAQTWLENKEIAVSTLENKYKYLLGWINRAIGHIPLEKLQVEHLQAFYKNLREDGVKKGGCYATPTGFVREYAKLKTTYKAFGRLSGVSFHSIRNAAQGRRIYQSTAQKISAALEGLGIDSKDMFSIDEKSRFLSDKTIHDIHFLIHTILDTARKRRIIPHCITEFMEPPRVSAKEARHLDDEDAKRFLSALMDEPDIRAKAALTILLFTGIRRGELCGLEWGDIDYNEGLIRIRRASQYVSGHGVLETPPKTKGSVRDITVTPFVLDIDFQIGRRVAQLRMDLNYTLLNGVYQYTKGSTSVALRSRGLLEAIQTNRFDADGASLTKGIINDALMNAIKNGADPTALEIWCNPDMLDLITDTYTALPGVALPATRTEGGVAYTQILTPYAPLSIQWEPNIATGQILLVNMGQMAVAEKPYDGLGVLFYEPLAKVGASERGQIYGELGTDYGAEWHHALIENIG